MAGAELPLVGRESELAVLDSVLGGVGAGPGRFLLVSGDPGIGKSRLLAELVERARGRGLTVGQARALESVRTAPYALLAKAVEAVLEAPLSEWMVEAAVRDDERPQARETFFERVGTALAERTAIQPALLVMDDLHWADVPSLRFLESQARAGLPPGLLVAGSYRPAAVQQGAPLTRLLGVVADIGAAERIELERLDAEAVADLCAATIGHGIDADSLADLIAETQGNPLFVVEVARAHQTGSAGARRPPPLPGAVRESVYGRLDALPDASVTALRAAAVLGGEFDIAPLAVILGLDQSTTLADLAPAESAALVATADGAWRYSFTHPLLCRVIYDGLTGAQRARLHLDAAQAIEGLSPGHGSTQLAALAYHFFRAVPVGGASPAIDYAGRAADHALASLAFEDAVRFYGDALDLADHDAAIDAGTRGEMMLRRADALVGGGETLVGRAAYAEAAAVAAAVGDRDRLARGALGRAGYRGQPGAPDLDAIALLETAMAAPADDPLLRARVGARLAMELYYLGERERRDALSADAVALVREQGDGAVLAQVLLSRNYALDEVDNLVERAAVATEAARLAEAHGDGETAMVAHYLLVRDRLEMGDRPAAAAAAERHRELARTARQPLYPWRVLLLDAMFAHIDGDLAVAEDLALEAHRVASMASIPNADAALWGLTNLIRWEQGRLHERLDLTMEGAARYPTFSAWAPMVALCQSAVGDRAGARVGFDRAMADLAGIAEDEAFLLTGWVLSNLAVDLDDRSACEQILQRYQAYADRVVVLAGPSGCAGPVALFLGRLATTLGRTDEARAYLRTAAAVAERLASPMWRAHVQAAEVTLAAGAPPLPGGLTEREVEVLRLISLGLTNREVADKLQLGVRTIDSHVTTMYRKVGARRRADAVALGVAAGLVDPPAP